MTMTTHLLPFQLQFQLKLQGGVTKGRCYEVVCHASMSSLLIILLFVLHYMHMEQSDVKQTTEYLFTSETV